MKKFNVFNAIRYYQKLLSTQNVVKELAKKNVKEGIVVVAEKQINGYGRIGRIWHSNIGGLWFSILLKPQLYHYEAHKFGLLMAIALNTIFEKYKVISQIKWPNDILVLKKKIAGIITETSIQKKKINWIVMGVGININNNLKKSISNIAISLKTVLGRKIDKNIFLLLLLMQFECFYANFIKNGFEQFVKKYNNKIAYKNEFVKITVGDNVVLSGVNLGIDKNGKLIIKTLKGIKKIAFGTLRTIK
ncbi:MAG: biotin--[acetyl-CoA-carboxylase] ligase [Endomicrobium sp.]|jgi:BirA family biotin operon repressor/biotin-[acetyl-CoA-carboxylase] ligase|nr:biotin--[acetyl-CoA-carboxylase] ligase [Endomicrobium sp.]